MYSFNLWTKNKSEKDQYDVQDNSHLTGKLAQLWSLVKNQLMYDFC